MKRVPSVCREAWQSHKSQVALNAEYVRVATQPTELSVLHEMSSYLLAHASSRGWAAVPCPASVSGWVEVSHLSVEVEPQKGGDRYAEST